MNFQHADSLTCQLLEITTGAQQSRPLTFMVPEDLMKTTTKSCKNVEFPTFRVGTHVRRNRNSRNNSLKTPQHYKYFPDEAVGLVEKIHFNHNSFTCKVCVKWNTDKSQYPQDMTFEASQLEETKDPLHTPSPPFTRSVLRHNGSYVSDLKASRVMVKKNTYTAKNSDFKESMIGLVRDIRLTTQHSSSNSGWFALVEIPFVSNRWYRCSHLVKYTKGTTLKGPKSTHEWFHGTITSTGQQINVNLQRKQVPPKFIEKKGSTKKWTLLESITYDFEFATMSNQGYALPVASSILESSRHSGAGGERNARFFKSLSCTADPELYVMIQIVFLEKYFSFYFLPLQLHFSLSPSYRSSTHVTHSSSSQVQDDSAIIAISSIRLDMAFKCIGRSLFFQPFQPTRSRKH